VPLGEAVPDGESVPDALGLPEGSAVAELGDAVALVGGADGLPEGEDEAGGCTGAHDRLLLAARPAAAAELDTTATPIPEAAVNRTPPATMAAVAGPACAKRIKTPYQYCSLLLRNDLCFIRWLHGTGLAWLPGYATYCTANAARVLLLSYPVVGQDHRVNLRILAVFGSLPT
jgi:hypothetical protein